MGDVVRCQCPHDSLGVRCGRHTDCALHGFTSPVPLIPWILTGGDKALLQSFRIGVSDVEETRLADERRFNQPRIQP